MIHKPLEGRKSCSKCGQEYEWHYYLRVPFCEEPNSKKLYDGKDGSVYNFSDSKYSAARLSDKYVLNCDKPDPVNSSYIRPFFWGFNVPVICNCGYCETEFVDLRESV